MVISIRSKIWVFFFCLFSTLSSYSSENVNFLGVTIPKHIQLQDLPDKLSLQGYAANLEEGEPFFVGALYTSKMEKRANLLLVSDFPLAIFYYILQEDLNPQRLLKDLTEDIILNNPGWLDLAVNQERLMELQSFFLQKLTLGDVISFQYTSEDELRMVVNNTLVKQWPNGRPFFNAVLRTWIGPYPPSRRFKESVLGIDNTLSQLN